MSRLALTQDSYREAENLAKSLFSKVIFVLSRENIFFYGLVSMKTETEMSFSYISVH